MFFLATIGAGTAIIVHRRVLITNSLLGRVLSSVGISNSTSGLHRFIHHVEVLVEFYCILGEIVVAL